MTSARAHAQPLPLSQGMLTHVPGARCRPSPPLPRWLVELPMEAVHVRKEHKEEMRGLAHALGIKYRTILGLNIGYDGESEACRCRRGHCGLQGAAWACRPALR